ncbi:MAG: cupin domain-containing protein, partial [Cohaesibacter sp.]|nr:cupin domain-containing protein [Cohaesibacter sp.]
YYVETFRDREGQEGRGHSTAIYYLLEAGDRSHWHRVDASEIWLWHAGAALELSLSADNQNCDLHLLGADLLQNQRPQVIVPKHVWQSARSLGAWTLVSCVVAPGFVFDGFEMAPPNWSPGL